MKTFVLLAWLVAGTAACTLSRGNPAFAGRTYCGDEDACAAACSGSDPRACGYIAQSVAGLGPTSQRSGEKLVFYATRGCAGGDGRSCHTLGYAYFSGVGVRQDFAKAAEYNERACNVGWGPGCDALGSAYYLGRGVAKDVSRAGVLFEKACDTGFAQGCASLAFAAPDGMVPESRAARALPLLVHDCDPHIDPLVRICTIAGRMYAAGRGAPADPVRARTLFGKACERGDPDACDLMRR